MGLRAALKVHIDKLVRALGYEIISLKNVRPEVVSSSTVIGSFPPYSEYAIVGQRENYYIHDLYQPRCEIVYHDDTDLGQEWQDEVYRFAREIADKEGLNTVCDIGCGSAYKLLKYFDSRTVIGLDVEKTCKWLKETYPDRYWAVCDFHTLPPFPVDIVIAADVIEHLIDPDKLLSYIFMLRPRFIVLSSPERNLLRAGTHNGPPKNPAHVREWNMSELHAYVSDYFEILEHFISNAAQCTQCILARQR